MRRVRGRSALAVEGSSEEAAGRLRFVRGLFPRGDMQEQQAVANRVRMAADALPMLLLANVAVAGGLCLLRWPLSEKAALLQFFVPLAVVLASGAGVMFLTRRNCSPTSPERMHNVVALFGLIQGGCWSAWMAGAGQDMTHPQWPLAAIAYSALLIISTLVFAPVPTAALALWLTLSITAAGLVSVKSTESAKDGVEKGEEEVEGGPGFRASSPKACTGLMLDVWWVAIWWVTLVFERLCCSMLQSAQAASSSVVCSLVALA